MTFITMAHGGGGKAMRDLIREVFASRFKPESMEDQARLSAPGLLVPGARIAFTTDAYVVSPLEFPGGDIGRLAVFGTVNDLAVGGAEPLWLSAAFILEEGFPIERLRRIVDSMAAAALESGVRIVTGDTKVVERGKGDGVFICTSGVGLIPPGRDLAAAHVRVGDAVLVNGTIGDHGAAIMATRGELALETAIESDSRPLHRLMQAVLAVAPGVRAARDATRGGLATVLNEIAEASGTTIQIDEAKLPLRAEVRGLTEILGLDPLYLANEGLLALFVPADATDAALAALRADPCGTDAAIIGRVIEGPAGRVLLSTAFGGLRRLDLLVGEQLPRIC